MLKKSVSSSLQRILDQMRNRGKSETVIRACQAELNHFMKSVSETSLETALGDLHERWRRFNTDKKKLEVAIFVCDMVLQCARFHENEVSQELVAKAMLGKAEALAELKQYREAQNLWDELEKRFDGNKLLDEWLARAQLGKGKLAKDPEEAMRLYDRAIARLESIGSPDEWTAKALVSKGRALETLKRSAEAMNVYDEVERRFGEKDIVAIKEQVAQALLQKGLNLQKNNPSQALDFFTEIDDRYKKSIRPFLREVVAKALFHKGEVLADLKDPVKAISTFEILNNRYRKMGNSTVRVLVAHALLRIGKISAQNNRESEARRAYHRVIKHFGRASDVGIKRHVQEARFLITQRAEGDPEQNFALLLDTINSETKDKYFGFIKNAGHKIGQFLGQESRFKPDTSFLLVLREWNSYTPALPADGEQDKGGGYFIWHHGEGIVIDPGYDFISNFYEAGGRFCDIDHIVLTHAHDDHTAEFESLLTLLHQYNSRRKKEGNESKQIGLYMSSGAQRKFAGLINLRDAKFRGIVTLYANEGCRQRLKLNKTITLTVLPAYHDDVVTKDMSVGLGFEISCNNETRRIVFTGDTSLFPQCKDSSGNTTSLDVTPQKALHNVYSKKFRSPDLLVAHMGSIQEQEFDKEQEITKRYYLNHLGALGVLTMINNLKPKVAIVSEFGAELKDFRIDLIDKLAQALSPHLVISGDRTIAYDIGQHKLLCHSNCQFEEPENLICRGSIGYVKKRTRNGAYDVQARPDETRSYLFLKTNRKFADKSKAEQYFLKFFNGQLPFHK